MEGCTTPRWLQENGEQSFFFLLLNTQLFLCDPDPTHLDRALSSFS